MPSIYKVNEEKFIKLYNSPECVAVREALTKARIERIEIRQYLMQSGFQNKTKVAVLMLRIKQLSHYIDGLLSDERRILRFDKPWDSY
jgi:hypothetical protein